MKLIVSIGCTNGFEYDKTWYDETVVSKEDWICDRALYVTNTFSFNRFGEVLGTFIFGQMGDTLGRRPVFFCGIVITILGRIACIFTSSIYWLFALASVFGMLTALTLFQSPLVIAMEICKGEKRAHIAMMQCYGWTVRLIGIPIQNLMILTFSSTLKLYSGWDDFDAVNFLGRPKLDDILMDNNYPSSTSSNVSKVRSIQFA